MKRTLLTLVFGLSFATVGLSGNARDRGGVEFLEQRVKSDPEDFIAWNQLGERYLKLLRESGSDEYLKLAEKAAAQSLRAIPPPSNAGGLALKSRVALAAHRFGEARDAARQLVSIQPDKTLPQLLLADALLELGDYVEVTGLLEGLRKREDGETAELNPRLTRLALIFGKRDEAREYLQEGLQSVRAFGIPAPDLVAWYSVQLSELAFQAGDWVTADSHLAEALNALPHYLPALDRRAELRAAEGKVDEAVSMFESLVAKHPRSPVLQALGDLLVFAGRDEQAKPWHEKARVAYHASVEAGAVHHYHHLAGFYADSVGEPQKAIEWARKDLELRHSIHAWDALAWAQYKGGEVKEAAAAIEKALATGTKDAHILHHAGMIFMSAGDIARGRLVLQQASQSNPRYNAFHVHR